MIVPLKLEGSLWKWEWIFTINKAYITGKMFFFHKWGDASPLMEECPPPSRFLLFSYLEGCKINWGASPPMPLKSILNIYTYISHLSLTTVQNIYPILSIWLIHNAFEVKLQPMKPQSLSIFLTVTIELLRNLQNQAYRKNVFNIRKRDPRKLLAFSVSLTFLNLSKKFLGLF